MSREMQFTIPKQPARKTWVRSNEPSIKIGSMTKTSPLTEQEINDARTPNRDIIIPSVSVIIHRIWISDASDSFTRGSEGEMYWISYFTDGIQSFTVASGANTSDGIEYGVRDHSYLSIDDLVLWDGGAMSESQESITGFLSYAFCLMESDGEETARRILDGVSSSIQNFSNSMLLAAKAQFVSNGVGPALALASSAVNFLANAITADDDDQIMLRQASLTVADDTFDMGRSMRWKGNQDRAAYAWVSVLPSYTVYGADKEKFDTREWEDKPVGPIPTEYEITVPHRGLLNVLVFAKRPNKYITLIVRVDGVKQRGIASKHCARITVPVEAGKNKIIVIATLNAKVDIKAMWTREGLADVY